MKKIIALILTLTLLCTVLASCSGAGKDLETVKESGKLVVGVTVYAPMDYVDSESGEWAGFDADLANMFAESLGGVETLVTYPMTQTHESIPADVREKLGINERFIRISIGIENVKDIIADLEQALA